MPKGHWGLPVKEIGEKRGEKDLKVKESYLITTDLLSIE